MNLGHLSTQAEKTAEKTLLFLLLRGRCRRTRRSRWRWKHRESAPRSVRLSQTYRASTRNGDPSNSIPARSPHFLRNRRPPSSTRERSRARRGVPPTDRSRSSGPRELRLSPVRHAERPKLGVSGDDADHRPPAPLRLEDKIEADGASQQMQLDGWAVDEKRFAFVLQDRSRRA